MCGGAGRKCAQLNGVGGSDFSSAHGGYSWLEIARPKRRIEVSTHRLSAQSVRRHDSTHASAVRPAFYISGFGFRRR